MKAEQEQLYSRYSLLEDQELITLYHDGGLTLEAKSILLRVLKERGIEHAALFGREEEAQDRDSPPDMNMEQQQLYDRYNDLTDAELIVLYNEGGLLPDAEAVLLHMIGERRIRPEEVGERHEDYFRSSNSFEKSGPKGLGGWLIVVGLGLFSKLIWIVRDLEYYYFPIFSDGTWSFLSDPSSSAYDPFLSFFIIWEIVFSIALAVMQVILIYLFFQRSFWFPKAYIWTLVAGIVFTISDAVILNIFYNEPYTYGVNWIITSSIWIAYMLKSKRVKNTFTRKGKEKEKMNEVPATQPSDRVALFDNWAQDYNPASSKAEFPFQGYDAVLDTVVDCAEPVQGMALLDLGIGTGNLAARFIPFDCKITGIDFSGEMLKKTAEKFPEFELMQVDLRQPLPESLQSRFDCIVSGYLFHELNDDRKAMVIERLVRESLKPGGRFVIGDISFPNSEIREMAHERWKQLWDETEHYWSAEEMKEKLEKIGLDVQYQQVSGCAGVYTLRS